MLPCRNLTPAQNRPVLISESRAPHVSIYRIFSDLLDQLLKFGFCKITANGLKPDSYLSFQLQPSFLPVTHFYPFFNQY